MAPRRQVLVVRHQGRGLGSREVGVGFGGFGVAAAEGEEGRCDEDDAEGDAEGEAEGGVEAEVGGGVALGKK